MTALAEEFQAERSRLFGLAYRLLGSAAEAEVNGEPAILAIIGPTLSGALFFEIAGEQLAALRIVANPDKLRFAARQLSHTTELTGP